MQTFISQVLLKSKLWPTVQNENESKKMKQCLLCKMTVIWGSVQFARGDAAVLPSPIIGHLETHQSGENQKMQTLRFLQSFSMQGFTQGVRGDTAPNHRFCTILGFGVRWVGRGFTQIGIFSENFSHTQLPILLHLKVIFLKNSIPPPLPP